MIKIAAFFLLLSGIASLTYQVVWVRLLGLTMGSTSASISTVLAAFFTGLALGSYLAERITRNRIDNLRVYIVLEFLIAAGGLLLLPLLLNLHEILAYLPTVGSNLSIKFLISVGLLLLPTVCMGATFPVMASLLIRRHADVGLGVSQLYSLNTAGAVLGAALAGFVFIPLWGLDGAVYIAVAINLSIVLTAIYLDKRLNLPALEVSENTSKTSTKSKIDVSEAPFRRRALLILFATGLVSIASEVGWTKYLSIFTGTTIYGFAAILSVFLLGIAAGSWFIRHFLQNMRRPEVALTVGLLLLGLFLLLTRAGLSIVPPIYEAINHLPAPASIRHGAKYFFVFLLIFPSTFILGALFPLNLKLYCGNLQGVRARIGKAYAINTVASIVGSLVAGFWFIPQYGTDFLLTTMAIIIVLLAMVFMPAIKGPKFRTVVVFMTLGIISLNWVVPHLSYKRLISSVQYQYDDDAMAGNTPTFLYLKEGKTGVISMVTYDDRHVKLQNNGLNESFIDLEDENNVLLVEMLLGLVPYMLHENPKTAFVVGFGGGITTNSLTFSKIEKIKVVELEPAVVEAGRKIIGGEIKALKDPRVTLEYNDARNTLLTDKTQYDIIVAQPSHPWLAHAANVFTQEFFKLVKSRLNEGGIYSQWVNLFNMDATTLRAIFKAFYNVFPEGLTFANLSSGDFIMFGSTKKMMFDYERMKLRLDEPAIKKALGFHKIHKPQDLIWYFALSRDEAIFAAADTPPNTDTNILSEVRLSALDKNPTGKENPYKFLREHYKLSILPYIDGDIDAKLYEMAEYYFDWGSAHGAQHLANQLKAINPILARGIEYEALWRDADYKAAFELFAKFDEWPDKTYFQQAVALIDLNRIAEAQTVVERIKDVDWRRGMHARILFEKQLWAQLSKLKVQGSESMKWQLVGAARTNLENSALLLEKLANSLELEIPQLQILVKYYSNKDNLERVAHFTRQLVTTIDARAERLLKIANNLQGQGDLVALELLLKKVQGYDPQVDNIKEDFEKLRKKSEQLRNKS